MADLSTGINEALQEGYSPDEVLSDLQKKYPNYAQGIAGAIKEGYKTQEILDHLTKTAQPQQTQELRPGQRMLTEGRQPDLPPVNFAGIPGLPIGIPEAQPTAAQKGWKGLLTDPLGFGHMFQAAGEIGQKAGSGQPYAGQAAGVAAMGSLATTPGARVVGRLAEPLVGSLARFGGPIAKYALKIPLVKPIVERIGDSFNHLVARTPLLEHDLMNNMAQHTADTNKAYVEVQELGKNMGAYKMSKESLAKVYDSYEAGPAGLKDLTSEERTLIDQMAPIKSHYTKLALQEGVIDEAHERYLTHMYEGKTGAFLKPIMKDAPISMKRTHATFAELEKTQRELEGEVNSKGISTEDFLKMNDKEIRAAGLNPNIKQTLSLMPIKDPIKAVQAQVLATRMAIATKKSILNLVDLKDEAGNFLIEHEMKPGYVKLDSTMFNKYAVAGVKETPNSRLVFFKNKPAFVQKQLVGTVNRLLNTGARYPEWLGYMNELNRATKQLAFYNPPVHDINLVTNALQVFGANFNRVLGLPGKRIMADSARLSEAIADGFQSKVVYDAKNSLQKDFGKILQGYKIPGLSSALDLVQNKVNNKLLWTYANHLGLTVWDVKKAQFIAQGMSREEAGKAAVSYAHDVIGTMNNVNSMKMFQNRYFNTFVAFIPAWVNSSWRKYTGALLPQQAFKHLTPLAQKALQTEYQHNLYRGITMGLISSQRLNYAFSGHSTFENMPQNRPTLTRPFGRIEIPHNGKIYAVDYPGFGSLTLPVRMMAALGNLATGHPAGALSQIQPITRTALTQAGNMQMSGKPIVPQNTPAMQQIMPRAKSALQTANPLGASNLMDLRNQNAGIKERAWEYILPIRVSSMDPAKEPILKMWQMYDNEKHYEVIALHEAWHDQLDNIIKQGMQPNGKWISKDFENQAVNLATLHGMKSPAFGIETYKYTKPIMYAFMKVPQNVRNRYFGALDPKDQQKLLDKINMEATQSNSTP